MDAQCEIAAWLEAGLWPNPVAMHAALDEAERSLVAEGGVPVDDVRKNLLSLITG